MFPTSSLVKHVQKDDDHDRFYAQAEVMLTEDMDHAELQLRDVDSSVYAEIRRKETVHRLLLPRSA